MVVKLVTMPLRTFYSTTTDLGKRDIMDTAKVKKIKGWHDADGCAEPEWGAGETCIPNVVEWAPCTLL
jgi:hypothetical protein